MALSFDGPARLNSITAWISKTDRSASPRLLIRQSGFTSHRVAQVGGTANGEFAEGSLVALSAMPVDARFPPFNWAAVVSGSAVHVVQHSMSVPSWRSPAMPLYVSGAIPIQRFPNRGYAVFLATAARGSDGVLVGAVVKSGDSSPHVWPLPLKARPLHAACAFEMAGAITVLYSSTEGATSRLHRIDVSEDGQLLRPETAVHETSNRELSVVADMRPGQAPSFIVLEADPSHANFLGFSRIPVNGPVTAATLRELPEWPMSESRGVKAPERAANIGFDLDMMGMPWLATTLADGRFYGGRLDGSVAKLSDGEQRCSFPHPGGITKSMTLSCFLENGMMFHSGGGAGHKMARPADNPDYGKRTLQIEPACSGLDVWELQIKLLGWGSGTDNEGIGNILEPMKVTGRFDRRTRDAVMRFQKALGLPLNGVVDSATFVAIDREPALYPVPDSAEDDTDLGIDPEAVDEEVVE